MMPKSGNEKLRIMPLQGSNVGLLAAVLVGTLVLSTFLVHSDASLTATRHDGANNKQLSHEIEVDLTGASAATGLPQTECNVLKRISNHDTLGKVSFSIHRNGEPTACGMLKSSKSAVELGLMDSGMCSFEDLDKYQLETFLTNMFASSFLTSDSCGSTDNATAPKGMFAYCDMGPLRTVPQHDGSRLLPTQSGSLPCRFYTREGRRVYSLQHLTALAEASIARNCTKNTNPNQTHEGVCSEATSGPVVDLYAVPASRVFMFAPAFVGEKFHLDHVQESAGAKPIVLEVISLNPRVFEIHGFYTEQEAENLIDRALKETSDTHKLHRSTTGATNGQVFNKRTSENAWDTNGADARRIKRRGFEVLGFDEYLESHADGLQVLRYQNTQAYTMHPDYLNDQGTENYNYNSAGAGGNRFATILLYMSDVGENDGGETFFQHAWPEGTAEEDKKAAVDAKIAELRASGVTSMLKEGSWEEEMTALCRTRLHIHPRKGRAVLFYSQHPNGVEDKMAVHGACPVLNGTKWAANLWVWNGARAEFDHAPRKWKDESAEQKRQRQLQESHRYAVFRNTGKDNRFRDAKLYYEDTFFANLPAGGAPVRVNTYVTHVWHIKGADDQVLRTLTITNDQDNYEIEV